MNEPLDPLEAELTALRPPEPSPRLRERIATQLSAQPVARPRILIGFAMAGALAATILVAAILVPWGLRRVVKQQPTDNSPEWPLAAASDSALPSVWSFHRALSGSADDLDLLLDKHAGLSTNSSRDSAQFRVFNPSDTEIHNLLGEL